MLIDSHTHLDHCREDAAALVADARAGRGRPHHPVRHRPGALALLGARWPSAFPEVFATVGFHPQEAGLRRRRRAGPRSRSWTAHPRVVAVGETGFDFYHDNWPHDVQAEVFVRHIDLARRAGLPVVIHTRDAAERHAGACWPSTPPG